jgi:hypothetical protein
MAGTLAEQRRQKPQMFYALSVATVALRELSERSPDVRRPVEGAV